MTDADSGENDGYNSNNNDHNSNYGNDKEEE